MLALQDTVVSMYTTCFNVQELISPAQCIYVFHSVLTINVGYFPKHWPTVTEMRRVFSEVRTESLNIVYMSQTERKENF